MVTVIGLGFVGLTTALGFAEYGHKVFGIEINAERMALIRNGELPFLEPDLDDVLARHLGNSFIPTDDWDYAISQSQCIYYCVGTPYGENGQADLAYLYNAIEKTLSSIHDEKFRVLVTKSTIPPTTTEKFIIPFLESHGINVPEKIGVANNPEFLREGHCWEDFSNPDRIVIGVSDSRSEQILKELYRSETAPVCCVSLNTAEFIKYLSNTSLACLISFANEMSLAADAFGGIDVAAAFHILHMDKRWQSGSIRSYFYPGCGYGGYCLPKDTNAFYASAKNRGFDGGILKNVIAVNDNMAKAVAGRIIKAADQNRNTNIGILGLSFNSGSDDVRDSSSARIIRELNLAGYEHILIYDPVAMDNFQNTYHMGFHCVRNYEEILEMGDVFAITTAWQEFGDILHRTNKPVIDCRYML